MKLLGVDDFFLAKYEELMSQSVIGSCFIFRVVISQILFACCFFPYTTGFVDNYFK